MQQATEDAPWDFRSPRFRDQAVALVRMTGCPLVLCRQELFIAEGDAVEAYMVLEERYAKRERPEDAH
jgi:hypothetical protein